MEKTAFTVRNSGIEETVYFTREETEGIFLPLLRRLTQLQQEKKSRILVLLAAPPGAGKTTLVQYLQFLAANTPGLSPVTAIGMDGFHRYQDYLLTHSIVRDGQEILMVKVKGAPETFDLPLLTERIRKVAAGEKCGWPAYDRLTHNPVEDAVTVDGDIVLLEGNYLLLDRDGWRDLRRYADYTVTITAPEEMLRARLVERKISTGVDRAEAEKFVDFSDLYNVRTCLRENGKADLCLRVTEEGFTAADT